MSNDIDHIDEEPEEPVSSFYERLDEHATSGVDEVRKLRPSEDGRAINAGAARAFLSEQEQEEREEEDRVDYSSLMQPDWKDRSRVNSEGKSVPSGGGGSGTGKAKQIVPSGKGKRGDDPGEPMTEAFYVGDLTPGEDAFYAKRPSDEPLRVLRAQARRNILHEVEPEKPDTRPRLWKYVDRQVYGVKPFEKEALHLYPGSARRALARHARECDPSRVEMIDNQYRKELRPSACVNAPRTAVHHTDVPPAPAPAWMDGVDEDELRRQVEIIRQQAAS